MPLEFPRFLVSQRAGRALFSGSFLFCVVVCHAQPAKTVLILPEHPVANFTDVAEKAGLTMQDVFGGVNTKKYIIETTGTGVAIFDYDNDGWLDIFIVHGTK